MLRIHTCLPSPHPCGSSQASHPFHRGKTKACAPQHPPLLWATTSQMASKSEMLRRLNWPFGCSSVKVDWVRVPARLGLASWGT